MDYSKLSVVVQSGGASSRMGVDKGLVPFQEITLIERIIKRVRPIADELLVTTNNLQSYQFLGIPLFPDIIPFSGALGGLYTALSASSNSVVAVVACDMPFVNPEMLSAERDCLISANCDAVIPYSGEGLEPFHAVYKRDTCLPHIETALQTGKLRVDAWHSYIRLRHFEPAQIKQYDRDMLCFFNINSPQDLQEAIAIASNQE